MSYTEKHIGTVRPIDLKGNTVEEWCKDYCQEKLSEINCKSYDSWIECFRHNFVLNDDTKYIVTDKRVFELVYDEEMDDDLICFANNNDGTISYGCEFYNGGTCLQELLCDCLDRHLEVNPLTEVVNQPMEVAPIDKVCDVFQDYLIEFCPDLLGYGGQVQRIISEFREKITK